MRELEFLPEWYPNLRRRKRMVMLQGWMTLLIMAGLVLWMGLVRRNVRASEMVLASLDNQMVQTQNEQKQLDEQLQLRQQLTQWQQIISKLGFPVEMSRMLQTLDLVMPREMSLLEISCNTEEVPVAATGAAAAQARSDKERQLERRLKVRIVGVSPTDVDLANFLTGLSEYTFFEQIALVRADGRSEGGHLMREFELTFFLNLDAAGQ